MRAGILLQQEKRRFSRDVLLLMKMMMRMRM
jgi:hypothetical protein